MRLRDHFGVRHVARFIVAGFFIIEALALAINYARADSSGGSGGGGGGGGGGTTTANQGSAGVSPWPVLLSTQPGTVIVGGFNVPDGGDVALGSIADGVWTGTGNSTVTSTLRLLHNDIISSIAAGANIIGKVGIDQTTPGTTNGVQVNSSALPSGAASSANQPTNAAQGAAIAGATGNMGQVETLSAAPTYTTATLNPLISDPAGNLIVSNEAGILTPVAMVVTTASHTAGTVVGTREQFSKTALYGTIQSITVTSKAVVTVGLKVYVFSSFPSSTTFTDAAALSINTADVGKQIAAINLSAPDSGIGTATVWSAQNVGIGFAGTNIYIAVITTGSAAFTPASTSDFSMNVTVRY